MNDGMHQGQRSLWDILGTEPTSDERAIKRAYAKRLKITRPDDDPAAFQQLRDAYEYALRNASMFTAQLAQRGSDRHVVTAPAKTQEVAALPEAATAAGEPEEFWSTLHDTPWEPSASTVPTLDPIEEASAPPEPPGTIEEVPADVAAAEWQDFLSLAQCGDVRAVLGCFLQRETLLNLDVHEEFELLALRYCAGDGYDIETRDILFEVLGWDNDCTYLARHHAELMRSAMGRYRADSSYNLFESNRDKHSGIACLLSQLPPSAYRRDLFNAAFTEQMKNLLQTVRWHHQEMLHYRLDIALFEQWERTVHAKRYFKQTVINSFGVGLALHFMLAAILQAAGLHLNDNGGYISLLLCQALAFMLLALYAFGQPAPLVRAWQALKERWLDYLPALRGRPGLPYLAWIVPFIGVTMLLFIPAADQSLQIAVTIGLCTATAAAGASTRPLINTRTLASIVMFVMFLTVFMIPKVKGGISINNTMLLLYCLLLLSIRTSAGLYAACGWPETMLPRLRLAWMIGCVALLVQLRLELLPISFIGAVLLAWGCIGMLFSACEFNLKAAWPIVVTPAITVVLLAKQKASMQMQPLLTISTVVALSVLYFAVSQTFREYKQSVSRSRLT